MPDPPKPAATNRSAPKLRNAVDIERNTHSMRRAFQSDSQAHASDSHPSAEGASGERPASWSEPQRPRSAVRLLIPEDTPR
jgi:hypothetical protein